VLRTQRSFEMKKPNGLKAVFGTAARAFTLILTATALLTFAGCESPEKRRVNQVTKEAKKKLAALERGESPMEAAKAVAPEQPRQESAAGVKKGAAAAEKPAVPAPESDFAVELNVAGNGVVIRKYTGPGGNIIIPATIQGMPVTEVDMNPPMQNDKKTSLISVVIPEGVRWVGGFRDCIALRSVTLPGSVTEIGEDAFYGCASLASIAIPNSVKTIGNLAFAGCTSLASITIPDSVTVIDNWAFNDCTSLTTVTISPVKRDWGFFGLVFKNCPKVSLASQAALRAAGYTGGF
jgi:hypothetical protein